MANMANNSVDLILTDPPYYQVKKDAWDNQWSSVEDFLSWLDNVIAEFWRILKPSGTLYLFCGHHLASDTEILMRQRFNVLSHIIWAKPNGRWNGTRKEDLRTYFPSTEHVMMCEHYGAEGFAKGAGRYHKVCTDLKKQTFSPLIEYFKQAKEVSGISSKAINEATGTQMCSHWFGYSQWQLPNKEQYEKLQKLFAEDCNSELSRPFESVSKEIDGLRANYGKLLAEHDDLKIEYQRLRRPFAVSKDVPHTNVWHYPPVQFYPGKHPCEKPAAMMEDIIQAASREGDVVFDAFMGSGATGKAALRLGRKFIGIEMDEHIFINTENALKN